MNDDKIKVVCSNPKLPQCKIPDFVIGRDVSNFPKDFKCKYCGSAMKEVNPKEIK